MLSKIQIQLLLSCIFFYLINLIVLLRKQHQAIRDSHFKNKGTGPPKPEASESSRASSPDIGGPFIFLRLHEIQWVFLSVQVGEGIIKVCDMVQENYEGNFTLMHSEGKCSF